MTRNEEEWVPEACTLPTAERPLRRAEFDDLLATALRDQQRLSSTLLRWRLDPAAEPTLRDLIGTDLLGEAQLSAVSWVPIVADHLRQITSVDALLAHDLELYTHVKKAIDRALTTSAADEESAMGKPVVSR